MKKATRNKRIVEMYLAWENGRPVYTLAEIGRRYDLTSARVEQIVKASGVSRNRLSVAGAFRTRKARHPSVAQPRSFWGRVRGFFGVPTHA